MYKISVRDPENGQGSERPIMVYRYELKKIIWALDKMPEGRGGGVAQKLENRITARLDVSRCPDCGDVLTPQHIAANPSCAETLRAQAAVLLVAEGAGLVRFCPMCGDHVEKRTKGRRDKSARLPDYAEGRF